jgi:hypothetical protein
MTIPMTINPDEHWLLQNRAECWNAICSSTNPPTVELTASVQAVRQSLFGEHQEPTATTLEIHMDAAVAKKLYQKLGELGRKMGWLPK